MKKALKIFLIVLASLAVLAVGATALVLHTDLHNRIIAAATSGIIDADVRCGDISLKLSGWPEVRVEVDSLSITYPHERYASLQGPHDPGTGVVSDTMAVVAGIEAVADIKTLREGKIAGSVLLRGLQAYAFRYEDGSANWDIFNFPEAKQKDDSSSAPGILASVELDRSRLAYIDRLSGTMAYAMLALQADGAMTEDNTALNVVLDSDRLMLRTGELGVLAKGASIRAGIDDTPSVSTADNNRWRKPAGGMRRFALPEFLRDESFRESDVDIHLDESITGFVRHWNPQAFVELEEGYVLTPAVPLRNSVRNARISLNSDAVMIDTVSLRSGSSSLALKGRVEGLARTLFGGGKGLWKLDLDIDAQRLNVNEFLAALGADSTQEQDEGQTVFPDEEDVEEVAIDSLENIDRLTKPKLIVVPANVLATARLNASLVNFDQFEISPLSAEIDVRGRKIRVRDLTAQSNKGNVRHLEAFYSTATRESITAGFDIGIDGVEADCIRSIFPQLEQSVAPLRTFQGDFLCEAAATVKLDTNMSVLLPTMEGTVQLHGRGLCVPDLGEYKRYARLLMFRQLKDIRLHDLDISGTISDNQVEVYPFLLQADRYSFALSGDQKLPSEFNYRATMIKSPLLGRFAGRVFGKNFKRVKFRMCKPQFKTTDVPVFYEEVDTLYRKVQQAVQMEALLGQSQFHVMMDRAKLAKNYSTEVEDLPEGGESPLSMRRITFQDSCRAVQSERNRAVFQGIRRQNVSGTRP